ncbi:L-arabinonolactonase [Luteibacter sp. Sphag1AF]|uniref:SMP-30/gluconolactonase/LRE family protein n=1 Tax=Luteibacter sp. Sphag1AF TaxID=2587031 RepID=UPI0016087020|nr:SMP-30/gluconolactonase/LRE family protein [Luteibacter sp. Sphag1AF]MBB3226250.1 L-arabinonolactonase [Luteibacter sp. Sphag1AF]
MNQTSPFHPLGPSRHALAEGVLWDDLCGVIRWTDIHASRLWQFDPATGESRDWALPARLACFALTHRPGHLLLALENQLARFDTATGQLVVLEDIEPEVPFTRANDGRCDRSGNLVFGTLNEGGSDKIASFYRYSAQGVLSRLALPKAAITNSICFSPDGETMYFTDSPTLRIMACDYDGRTGDIDRIRGFAELDPTLGGEPDGSTVDADGFLWNAQWGASRVVRYAPDGRMDTVVHVDARQPSCVAFVGHELDQLAITSARQGLEDLELSSHPLHGAVFLGKAPTGRGLRESRYGHASQASHA